MRPPASAARSLAVARASLAWEVAWPAQFVLGDADGVRLSGLPVVVLDPCDMPLLVRTRPAPHGTEPNVHPSHGCLPGRAGCLCGHFAALPPPWHARRLRTNREGGAAGAWAAPCHRWLLGCAGLSPACRDGRCAAARHRRTHESAVVAAAVRVCGCGGGMRCCFSARAAHLLLLVPLAASSLFERVPLLGTTRRHALVPVGTAGPCDADRCAAHAAQFLTRSGAVVRHVRIAPMRHAFSIW